LRDQLGEGGDELGSGRRGDFDGDGTWHGIGHGRNATGPTVIDPALPTLWIDASESAHPLPWA